jgi:hypothetical protein
MVKLCNAESTADKRILSVVDAAHSIGQEVDIKLDEAAPDFWVSVSRSLLVALSDLGNDGTRRTVTSGSSQNVAAR